MAISSIPDRYARLVIIPIAHIDALLIQSIGGLAVDFRGRDVLIAVRPALRQLTAGIGAAIEQLGGSLTARLTGQPHVSAPYVGAHHHGKNGGGAVFEPILSLPKIQRGDRRNPDCLHSERKNGGSQTPPPLFR